MAKIETVRPGDLITAARFNELIAHVLQLQDRVAALEGGAAGTGQKPVILDTVPTDQVRAGAPLEVIGLNFTPGNDIITVGGFPIEAVDGRSTSTRLLFDVPLITVPGSSRPIFLTVRNTFGVASKPLTLLPALRIPRGNLAFGTEGANPGNLLAGNTDPYVFGLTVTSQTDIAETYQMSLDFTNVTGNLPAQAWRNATTLRDSTGALISPQREIRLEPGVPFRIGVHLLIPATATANVDGVDITVVVRSMTTGAGLNGTTSIPVRVGARTETSDPGVDFSIENEGEEGDLVRVASDGTLEFPFKRSGQTAQTATLTVLATFNAVANSTEYSATITPSSSVWTIEYGPTGVRPGKQVGQVQLITSFITLNQENLGAHPEQAQLKVSAVRRLSDGSAFTSFRIFNIRGY
jgi:hypothetical protein